MLTAPSALATPGPPLATAGTPARAAEPCTPTAETGCLAGVLRGGSGPIPDVAIEVTGPESSETVITGADGSWSAVVPVAGQYTLTLDVGTLPAGEQLSDPDANPLELRAVVGATRNVNFPVGPATSDVAPDDAGEEAPDPDDGDAVLDDSGTVATGSGLNRFLQQGAAGIRFGLVLALASVGLSLVFGTTGLSSFSHGEQVTLGAMLTYVQVALLGWPLVPSIVVAVVLCALSGWAQDAGIWRPLRRRGVGIVQAMIVTIGLSLALQYLFQLIFGGGTVSILNYIPGSWSVGPVRLNIPSYVAMLISTVALLGVAFFLTRTRTGRATRAVADNTALAAASGIDVNKIIRLVWIMATGLAGLAGALLALIFNGTNWMLGMQLLFLMFAAVTLGGLGTAFGALVGSLVIGVVVEMANLVIPSDLKYAAALLILILVLLVRPQGMLGRAERIG